VYEALGMEGKICREAGRRGSLVHPVSAGGGLITTPQRLHVEAVRRHYGGAVTGN
jgi:hypothetical protein